jgi:hypothetical protein
VRLAFHANGGSTLADMSVEGTKSAPGAHIRVAGRLRKIGIVALLAGGLGAGFVYWRGKSPNDPMDDPSMGGFNKANQRQMELMYGKMGTMTEDLVQHLKRPGTQAALIAIGGVLVAVGCFYFARLISYGADPETDT